MQANHELLGIHHMTAMTSDVQKNYEFFTKVLGMKLVKKTVNQDDIQTYHTYYADDVGTPGTTMTFFDFPNSPQGIPGTNAITRTSFRVPSDEALEYYKKRFKDMGVFHDEISEEFGKKILKFQDADNQRYQLISDRYNSGMLPGTAWIGGPVPEEFAIYGLGPTEISVSYFTEFKDVLEGIFGFKEINSDGNRHLFEVGEKGSGAQVILVHDDKSPDARQGYGEVHHVAFRLSEQAGLYAWKDIFDKLGLPNSGYVDRFYFESLYVRIGHILIELATDAPGFMIDEEYDELGKTLSLAPFIENKREYIEKSVKPFVTE